MWGLVGKVHEHRCVLVMIAYELRSSVGERGGRVDSEISVISVGIVVVVQVLDSTSHVPPAAGEISDHFP